MVISICVFCNIFYGIIEWYNLFVKVGMIGPTKLEYVKITMHEGNCGTWREQGVQGNHIL